MKEILLTEKKMMVFLVLFYFHDIMGFIEKYFLIIIFRGAVHRKAIYRGIA